jgi:aminopeptidase N
MVKKKYIVLFILLAFRKAIFSQITSKTYTREDSLRGANNAERTWWDIKHYALMFDVDFAKQRISGSNTIRYQVLRKHDKLQIDLQTPMSILYVLQDQDTLKVEKIAKNAYWIYPKAIGKVGEEYSISIYFEGKPRKATNPPWDGGWQWVRDKAGKPWTATTCQGLGASVWWPCKDHMADEPDSLSLYATVPKGFTAVANGRLSRVDSSATKTGYQWVVQNPINNYGVNLNIGNYVAINKTYNGINGPLSLQYWVLPQNLNEANRQFAEVPRMLEAFEHWFGPYPFYDDGYKLVQVPYLGMEHQSSVTYGNQFKNGYLGKDLSGTGVGLLWDFIIVHESGHEWWANSLTYQDQAHMWLHESFTAYSETLFTEYYFGKESANKYLIGTRKAIENKTPIVGPTEVNYKATDSDQYYKGANMLHTIRQVVNNDSTFRAMLCGVQKRFYHQTVTSKQVEQAMTELAGMDLSEIFNHYLYKKEIPELSYQWKGRNTLQYRYSNTLCTFAMPLKVEFNNKIQWITPTIEWQSIRAKKKKGFMVDKNFYIKTNLHKD